MDIEEKQVEERYEAIDKLVDKILDVIEAVVDEEGGDGTSFVNGLCKKELPNLMMVDLQIDMPANYGVKTKQIYHQPTIDCLT